MYNPAAIAIVCKYIFRYLITFCTMQKLFSYHKCISAYLIVFLSRIRKQWQYDLLMQQWLECWLAFYSISRPTVANTLPSEYPYFVVSLATASTGIFLLYYLYYQKNVAIMSFTFCLPYRFQVSLVINYDLPNNRELYIHRIGRSGRFGRKVLFLCFLVNLSLICFDLHFVFFSFSCSLWQFCPHEALKFILWLQSCKIV